MDSNSSISKINKSRYNLKKYLEHEWDVSTVYDLSDSEIEKLYRTPLPKNNKLQFGYASGCNFSLFHKKVPSHRLHIIYYNFPEIGKPPVKVTKLCSDKIMNLYKDEVIQQEDSVIVILCNIVPDNLVIAIEELYSKGQEELNITGLSEQIHSENEKLEENKYVNQHFKNIHIFHLDSLSVDIMSHRTIPKHIPIRDKPTIDSILEECNATLNQLPIILRKDAMAKRLRLAPGDICKIIRITQTGGETPYYRVCK